MKPNLHGSVTEDSGAVSAWEAAYERFETPAQEVAKFTARLRWAGATTWPKDAAMVELFCGRGNGLIALAGLGFTNLTGVDISADLLKGYRGPGRVLQADCRSIPLPDGSADFVIVQGGLHHLPEMPGDLDQTLREARRLLRPGGRVFFVEPWLTPFLRGVHFLCFKSVIRKLSGKMDALATMIEHERFTYEQWLGMPEKILALLDRYFTVERRVLNRGKIRFVGKVQ